jgi:hypothetical protein
MTNPPFPVSADAARATEAGHFGIRFRAWAWVASLGVLLMVIGISLISLVIAMWPIVADATTRPTGEEQTFDWLGFTYHLTPDAALILLVVLVSALGSFVHAATSFADYVGNRQLRISWVWWYLLRVLARADLLLRRPRRLLRQRRVERRGQPVRHRRRLRAGRALLEAGDGQAPGDLRHRLPRG